MSNVLRLIVRFGIETALWIHCSTTQTIREKDNEKKSR
jgi:hypothetical protein